MLLLLPDRGLQGYVPGEPAPEILPGPTGRTGGKRHRHGPLPVLHQYDAILGAGPPQPADPPQRGDQHHPGQCGPDAGKRRDHGLSLPARRGHGEGPAGDRPHRLRLRHAGQHPGISDDERHPSASGRDDDHPGALAEGYGHGPEKAGYVPLLLHHDGALGRPRRHLLLRRRHYGCRAGPERPAARPILHHHGPAAGAVL